MQSRSLVSFSYKTYTAMIQAKRMDPDTSSDLIPVTSENFELWLRMATDNKITTENTWNFALIDYFHDFRMLQDGDSINFIKASTTLDGCTKIYSNRVESAVKDTGSLLTTLNLRYKKKGIEDDEDEDGDEDNIKKKKKKQRRIDRKKADYILNSFRSLSIKESERPIKFDPVFKNALAEFDEGGAKSLVNNILKITPEGKVSFDFDNDVNIPQAEDTECDLNVLKDLVTFDLIDQKYNVCPSLDELKTIMEGKKDPVRLLESLDKIDVSYVQEQQVAQLRNNNDNYNKDKIHRNQETQPNNDVLIPDFDNGFYNGFEHDYDETENFSKSNHKDELNVSNGNNDMNTSRRTNYSLYVDGVSDDEDNSFGPNLTLNRLFEEEPMEPTNYTINKPTQNDEELLEFFQKMDSRPQLYWKIARVKRNYLNQAIKGNKESSTHDEDNPAEVNREGHEVQGNRRKKKRQAFNSKYRINFLADDPGKDEEKIFETTEQLSKIMLREKQRKSGRHLLPNILSFATKSLAFLTIKPNQRIYSLKRYNQDLANDYEVNSEYFAQSYNENISNVLNNSFSSPPPEYGSDPFIDPNEFVDPTGVEGFDAPLPHSLSQVTQQTQTQIQSQFSSRSNMLHYERRAKKVDIKLLKENIWKSIQHISICKKKRSDHFEDNNPEKMLHADRSFEQDEQGSNHSEKESDEDSDSKESDAESFTDESNIDNNDSMHFTNVVKEMAKRYDENTKKDLSTSFCFICLLHLANEQGLNLETKNNHQDIVIHK